MSDADFDLALDLAVRETGVERYRHLCSGANVLTGGNSRESWRRFILDRRWEPGASPAPAEARPSVAESLALTRAMAACPYRSTTGCGCSGARCALRAGRTVAHPDCFDCLTRYG